jgi:hypothetical protein
VLERVKTLKPDIVILSAFWDYSGWLVQHKGFDQTYSTKLLHTIEDLKAAGVPRVVVIGSAPNWRFDVPKMLIGEVRKHPNDPVPQRLSRRYQFGHDDLLLKVTTEQAGGEFVSIYDYLCDSSSCAVTTGQDWHGVMTSDSAHFTVLGSTMVVENLWEQISRRAN